MQVLEQGSGEPRVLPSPLIELATDEKGVERPGSLSLLAVDEPIHHAYHERAAYDVAGHSG